VVVLPPERPFSPLDIVTAGRLAQGVKKSFVLATLEPKTTAMSTASSNAKANAKVNVTSHSASVSSHSASHSASHFASHFASVSSPLPTLASAPLSPTGHFNDQDDDVDECEIRYITVVWDGTTSTNRLPRK
jgi:hypothetical protein